MEIEKKTEGANRVRTPRPTSYRPLVSQPNAESVSQSLDLKGILETVWKKIAGRKRPELDVENVHIELQQLILSRSKPILIILDDVCSINSLEKLLFEGSGCKTLITTRDKSIIITNPSTQLYQLPFLGAKDALSLFCFWATRQTSISSDKDANIMQEVQAKCDGLPLSLKVIGSSFNGEPHEDRKICVDALLDIWVYGRKLEKHNAFAILSKLTNKNLLKFTRKSRGSRTISYANASELYISQYNVMRDLVSYLAHKNKAVHSKRLVITRTECGLLSEGELIKDSVLDTQMLSVLAEPMEKNHLHDIDLPETEALLLAFTSREYILSPFLKSMKKFKFFMNLPYDIGNMSHLRILRLSALPGLKELPVSIGKLEELEYLDISVCEGLKQLPKEIGQLKKLREFDMREFSRLRRLPTTICELSSLKLVVCDWKIGE
ncbi:probable disease resistance protein At4g33300 [Cryptomeria japonica]|uniref:probable disease resistance protein At4g33300 n=1 Tax=Cryptomeria japonica TaxID=3369 RepID=UPI0027DA2A2E|nr:probable disease resistance protein At4g33300 [Cryptomeria japonica]